MIQWVFNDGGRAAAGFKGTTGDCVARAIAIAAEMSYPRVYNDLNLLGRKHERTGSRKCGISNSRTGVYRQTIHRYLESIGWEWVPLMFVGKGCTTHLRASELPPGRIIVSLSKHVAAVVDGVLYDIYDCSRNGNRCVYGYWRMT